MAKERLLKIKVAVKSSVEPRIVRKKGASTLQPKTGVSCKSHSAVQLLCQLPLYIPYLFDGLLEYYCNYNVKYFYHIDTHTHRERLSYMQLLKIKTKPTHSKLGKMTLVNTSLLLLSTDDDATKFKISTAL